MVREKDGFEIPELGTSLICLPKKLSQVEVKKLYVQQWQKKKLSYQFQMFSGHEAEDTLHNMTSYLRIMNEDCFNALLERLRFKDNCKKLKDLDDLSDAELKMKLVILGVL